MLPVAKGMIDRLAAMQASPRYTTDVEAATAVLAYDYCQMSWLVAAGFGGECLPWT